MSDDEDWFERALRETDEGGEGARDSAGTDPLPDESDGDGDPDAERGEPASDDPGPTESDRGSGEREGTERDGDAFGGPSAESDPFGGVVDAEGGDDPFGGPAAGGDELRFDDADFAALGGGAESGGPGGAGVFGDQSFGAEERDAIDFDEGAPDFDEETFDSDIDRIDVGIAGLDEMILGGVPERSLMVAIGSAGTGKTTFGLQFLTQALREGGTAVYITLEESEEAILSTAEEKGWPFREWVEADRLAVVSLDPIEMANSLASIRSDISRLVGEFGADRLVLDSVSLLEMMYDDPATRRSEVFDFARSLKRAGVTTMLTSEASEDNPYASRYGIVEYLVDAVFILQYVRPSNFRETRLAVEIQKIRDANHSRETKPYEITNDGISVYRQANIF